MSVHHPDRTVALQGATNFRDLGGYPTADGRTVAWRRLYRSDHLAGLTEADLATLAARGVARSADFRGVAERRAHAYDWPGVAQHALSIEPTVVQRAVALMQAGQRLQAQDAVALMQETYLGFVRDNSARFAELFRLLLANDAPLVFHCTAGKDRTGFAAALILHALGVARQDIEQDYLLTNALYQRPAEAAGPMSRSLDESVLQVLWKVQPEFLHAAWRLVDADYGGMDAYLRDVIGLDSTAQAELRTRYLR